jgi:uncharacterized protein (DUF1684 family)
VADFLGDWQAWREGRERRLRDPRGWLAITAIHWLTEQPRRYDDVPGTWVGGVHEATVMLGPGESLATEDDLLSEGTHRLAPLDEGGLTLGFDGAVAQVAVREGSTIVRPRHPDSPNLRAYRSTPCYPPDPAWVLPARLDGGEVVFTYAGAEHRLVAWPEDDGCLWILFRDATSGVTTYPANRQLLTAAPGPDGAVDLDLNRAFNMPCAYTDFATCPLPPATNTLPFAVEAGEQIPRTETP